MGVRRVAAVAHRRHWSKRCPRAAHRRAHSDQGGGNRDPGPHITAWNGQRTSAARMNRGVRHGRGTVEWRGDCAQRRYGGDRGQSLFPAGGGRSRAAVAERDDQHLPVEGHGQLLSPDGQRGGEPGRRVVLCRSQAGGGGDQGAGGVLEGRGGGVGRAHAAAHQVAAHRQVLS